MHIAALRTKQGEVAKTKVKKYRKKKLKKITLETKKFLTGTVLQETNQQLIREIKNTNMQKNFAYSRFLLYFDLVFFGTKTFLKGFILCKYRKDKQVSGEARSRVNYG